MSDSEKPDTSAMLAYMAILEDYTIQIESENREFIREVGQLKVDGVEFKETLRKSHGWPAEITAYLEVGKDLALLIAAIFHAAEKYQSLKADGTKSKIRAKKISPEVRRVLKELASLMDVETDEDVDSDNTDDKE